MPSDPDTQLLKDLYASICSQTGKLPAEPGQKDSEAPDRGCCVLAKVSGISAEDYPVYETAPEIVAGGGERIAAPEHSVWIALVHLRVTPPRAPPIIST